VRETAVLGNIVVGTLLVVCGVNVPLDELPNGLSTIAQGLPLTHGIEAARQLASGATLDSVFGLIGTEALVGAIWGLFGYGLLRFFELQSFRQATLDRA
jgi:ABC-2 type transport system permease protein